MLLLYGHGDGGGGPTDDMVQRLSIAQDVDGLCQVSFNGPDEYFDAAEARVKTEGAAKLPVWRGELYLELHRGTLTSQQQLKKLNRRCEQALHDAEAAGALATAFGACATEAWRLESSWKAVLLNQFHDVLPGSCTSDVVIDATSSYSVALSASASIIQEACSRYGSARASWETDYLSVSDPTLAAALVDSPDCVQSASLTPAIIAFNSLSVQRCEIICVPSYYCSPSLSQTMASNSHLQWAMCEFSPLSLAPIRIRAPPALVSVCKSPSGFIMQHSTLQVHMNNAGVVTSCLVLDSETNVWREGVKSGGSVGKLQLFKDVPLFWDAWDVEFYYESEQLQEVTCCGGSIVDAGPLLCSVRFEATIGLNSRAEVVYTLHANEQFLRLRFNIHWNESHSLLRVSFDTSVDADDWLADSQFSVINRSSRRNTSWDRAKFEAAGHKWIAVREHGMMVSVINDCTYGHSCFGGTLSSSMLRSPTHPDPSADRGFHVFNMAFMPSPSPCAVERIIAAARSFNAPVRTFKLSTIHADDAGKLASLELGFSSSCAHVVVDTVKLPFAWTAKKMQFDNSVSRETSFATDFASRRQSPPLGFVTPSPDEQSNLRHFGVSGRMQRQPITPRSPVETTPLAAGPTDISQSTSSADSSLSTPQNAFETPPMQSAPSSQAHRYSTPVHTPLNNSTQATTPQSHDTATAPRLPPPGTCVIIVRVFEAAGGVAPSVCLRSQRR